MTSSVRELIIFTQTYKAVLYCQNKEILIVCLNKKCVFYIRDTVVYQVLPLKQLYWPEKSQIFFQQFINNSLTGSANWRNSSFLGGRKGRSSQGSKLVYNFRKPPRFLKHFVWLLYIYYSFTLHNFTFDEKKVQMKIKWSKRLKIWACRALRWPRGF